MLEATVSMDPRSVRGVPNIDILNCDHNLYYGILIYQIFDFGYLFKYR